MIFYHGTKSTNVRSILATGLNAGFGWGAEKPGVFLSRDKETALYWAKTSIEKSGDTVAQPAVIQVEIPESKSKEVIPRKTSFAQPGDMQYLGSIPPDWLSLSETQNECISLVKQFAREYLR